MNKKTIIMAPLAVLAMGLTSCNSWAKIDKTKASEIGTKIIEKMKDMATKAEQGKGDAFDSCAISGSSSSSVKVANKYNYLNDKLGKYSGSTKIDVKNYIINQTSTFSDDEYSGNETKYIVLKDKKLDIADDIRKICEYYEYDDADEAKSNYFNLLAKTFSESSLSAYTFADAEGILELFDEYSEKYKNVNDTKVEYSYSSNGENNLKFTANVKFNAFEKDLFNNYVFIGQNDWSSIEYTTCTIEVCFENLLPTKFAGTIEIKGKTSNSDILEEYGASEAIDCVEKDEQSVTFTYNKTSLSFNESDYCLVKGEQ